MPLVPVARTIWLARFQRGNIRSPPKRRGWTAIHFHARIDDEVASVEAGVEEIRQRLEPGRKYAETAGNRVFIPTIPLLSRARPALTNHAGRAPHPRLGRHLRPTEGIGVGRVGPRRGFEYDLPLRAVGDRLLARRGIWRRMGYAFAASRAPARFGRGPGSASPGRPRDVLRSPPDRASSSETVSKDVDGPREGPTASRRTRSSRSRNARDIASKFIRSIPGRPASIIDANRVGRRRIPRKRTSSTQWPMV